MKVNIGDLVRFLNTTGGGTVTRMELQKGIIYVRDESGFEIPVQSNDIVIVTEGSSIVPKVSLARKDHNVYQKNDNLLRSGKEKDNRKRDLLRKGKVNAYLCFLPEEGSKIEDGKYETFVVNDSDYDLLMIWTAGCDNTKRELIYHNIVPFDSIELIDSFSSGKDLGKRSRNTITLIPFIPDMPFPKKDPYVVDVKVDSAKFLKKGAYLENDFFDEPAIVYPLVENDRPYLAKKIDPDLLAERMMTPISDPKQKKENRSRIGVKHQIINKGTPDTPLVVDLHAHELLDTTAGMDHKAILEYQLAKVREVMLLHKKPNDKGAKIIFIHGKGEGILRDAVTSLIKKEYPRCRMQDASFQEYGFGATQVTVH